MYAVQVFENDQPELRYARRWWLKGSIVSPRGHVLRSRSCARAVMGFLYMHAAKDYLGRWGFVASRSARRDLTSSSVTFPLLPLFKCLLFGLADVFWTCVTNIWLCCVFAPSSPRSRTTSSLHSHRQPRCQRRACHQLPGVSVPDQPGREAASACGQVYGLQRGHGELGDEVWWQCAGADII